MGSRRKSREMAVQVLYQMDVNKIETRLAVPYFRELVESDSDALAFTEELVRGFETHKREIDKLLQRHSKNWRLDRMAWVDRNVLRLAAYELMFKKETPPKVVINEAIDLGKKFGSSESGSFINGILDSIHHELYPEDGDPGKESL